MIRISKTWLTYRNITDIFYRRIIQGINSCSNKLEDNEKDNASLSRKLTPVKLSLTTAFLLLIQENKRHALVI